MASSSAPARLAASPRALGPSLSSFGITDTLADPVLELHDSNGAILRTNESWLTDPGSTELLAAGLAPGNTDEAAILTSLAPGTYTAVVRGKDSNTGVALAEVYNLP